MNYVQPYVFHFVRRTASPPVSSIFISQKGIRPDAGHREAGLDPRPGHRRGVESEAFMRLDREYVVWQYRHWYAGESEVFRPYDSTSWVASIRAAFLLLWTVNQATLTGNPDPFMTTTRTVSLTTVSHILYTMRRSSLDVTRSCYRVVTV